MGKPTAGTWQITTSGPATPQVTASVIDAKSEPKDASTPVLKPTAVGAPLTALPASPVGQTGDDAPVLEIVLVLLVLLAGLALTLTISHRRHVDAD